MHTAILVLGPDPIDRCLTTSFHGPMPDWAAIGGRYTGMLLAKPNATSARVYGDAVPDFEAAVVSMISKPLGELYLPAHHHRPGASATRPGVDQVEIGELASPWTAPGIFPYAVLDVNELVYMSRWTYAERVAAMTASIGAHVFADHVDKHAAALAAVEAKDAAFRDRVTRLLRQRPPRTLATIVDVHL